jgi:hypothetical protein
MPKPSAIKHPLLARLVRELRLISREALLRDIDNIEALAPDVDPATDCPLDWLTFRITGFRAQGDDDDASPRTIPGHLVLADLSAVCEHLCDLANLRTSELDSRDFSRPRDLCEAWTISPSTFKRLRKQGLVCRLARDHRNVASLLVRRSVADWFQQSHHARLTTTRGKPRTPAALRDRMVREALRYQRVLKMSPHAISARLAQRHAPSPSAPAIRQLLAKHPRTRNLFQVREHPALRSRLAMLRLHLRGVAPESIAAMAERSTPVIRRDLAIARAHLLHAWCDQGLLVEHAPPAIGPGADAFAAPDDPAPEDLALLLAWWQARKPLTPRQERDLLLALAANRGVAFALARSLDRLHPSPVDLDRAETHARRASIFHERLLHSQGRLILDTIRVRTQQPPEQLPLALLQDLLRASARTLSDAILALDPAKSGRIAGAAALGIDRAITRLLRERTWPVPGPSAAAKRAQSVLIPGTSAAPVLRLRQGLIVWDRWLWPMWPRVLVAHRDSFARLPAPLAALLTRRFGLLAPSPQALHELRAELNLSPIEAARQSCRALAALRQSYPPS